MREDLRQKALKVLPSDIDFGEYEEEDLENGYNDPNENNQMDQSKTGLLNNQMFNKGRNGTQNPFSGGAGGGERLNTIEEEEKQYETQSNIFKTNDRNHNKSGTFLARSNKIDNSSSFPGVASDSDIYNKDPRTRLDDYSEMDRSYNNVMKSDNDVRMKESIN